MNKFSGSRFRVYCLGLWALGVESVGFGRKGRLSPAQRLMDLVRL